VGNRRATSAVHHEWRVLQGGLDARDFVGAAAGHFQCAKFIGAQVVSLDDGLPQRGSVLA